MYRDLFLPRSQKNYYYKTKPTITNALSVTDPPHLHPWYFPIKLTRTCTTHMRILRSRRLLIDPRVPILDTLLWTFTQILYGLLSNHYYTISCRRCWSASVNSNWPPLKNQGLDKTSDHSGNHVLLEKINIFSVFKYHQLNSFFCCFF